MIGIQRTHLGILFAFAFATAANAQTGRSKEQPSPTKPAATASSQAPSSLVILFDIGSSELHPKDRLILDRASRTYNEGKPIVMIVTGSSDRSGSAQSNLTLSQQRATAVLRGLLERGIPADRFQVLAKGETELPVPTPKGVVERENRRVVISWH